MLAGFVADEPNNNGRLFTQRFCIILEFLTAHQIGNHFVRYLTGVRVIPASAQVDGLVRADAGNRTGTG